nr:hypothetical protein TQ38_08440 [Novosphingobium sp. P6W]
MTVKPHRPLALLLCTAMALALGACGKEPDSPTASNEATLTGPDAKPGLVASDGKLVLPVIARRPAAVYFTVRNDGAEPVTLAAVSILGAGKAEMHETKGGSMGKVDSLPVDPGASVVFAPGGLHVMVFDLPAALKAGGKAELTMTFSDGDKLSMPLAVEAMGGDMGDMEGMHH